VAQEQAQQSHYSRDMFSGSTYGPGYAWQAYQPPPPPPASYQQQQQQQQRQQSPYLKAHEGYIPGYGRYQYCQYQSPHLDQWEAEIEQQIAGSHSSPPAPAPPTPPSPPFSSSSSPSPTNPKTSCDSSPNLDLNMDYEGADWDGIFDLNVDSKPQN